MNKFILIGVVLMTALSGCMSRNERATSEAPSAEPPVAISVSPEVTLSISEETVSQSTTQNDLSGNHIVNGSIDLQTASYIDIPLDEKPLWLVSAPYNGSAVFVAITENGEARAFKIAGQSYKPMTISPSQLPAGMPPLLAVSEDGLQLILPPAEASPLTNPILVDGKLVYIALNGDLVLVAQSVQTLLPINAVLDARILVDEKNRLLVLTQPTDRYDHGILGDSMDGSAIVLIETEPELRALQIISIQAPDVIEGISAIWADIDNDGARDIIVTLSNNQSGSRIAAYHEDGALLAESDPIGLGHRWRHQIAVALFAADQPALLVSVRTPHIGGIVEFLRYNNGRLQIVKEIGGFSTHSIGSRNLDSGLAGDFNNDGIFELLAPDQSHTGLGIVSLDGVVATLSLNSVLTTNLSGTSIDGNLYVGAGTQNNLRVWLP